MPFIRRGTLCVRKTQQPRKGCAPPVAACCAAGHLISLSRAPRSSQQASKRHIEHLLSIASYHEPAHSVVGQSLLIMLWND